MSLASTAKQRNLSRFWKYCGAFDELIHQRIGIIELFGEETGIQAVSQHPDCRQGSASSNARSIHSCFCKRRQGHCLFSTITAQQLVLRPSKE